MIKWIHFVYVYTIDARGVTTNNRKHRQHQHIEMISDQRVISDIVHITTFVFVLNFLRIHFPNESKLNQHIAYHIIYFMFLLHHSHVEFPPIFSSMYQLEDRRISHMHEWTVINVQSEKQPSIFHLPFAQYIQHDLLFLFTKTIYGWFVYFPGRTLRCCLCDAGRTKVSDFLYVWMHPLELVINSKKNENISHLTWHENRDDEEISINIDKWSIITDSTMFRVSGDFSFHFTTIERPQKIV